MIRIFFRILAYFLLALALITAVLDLTRSIADSAISIRPLGLAWFEFSPTTLLFAQGLIEKYTHPYIWNPIIQTLLLAPSWLVFGTLWLLISFVTMKRGSSIAHSR